MKTTLVALAVAAFALLGIAVRAAHPGSSGSAGTSTAELSPPSDLVAALNEGGDDGDFSGTSIGPAQGTPATSTSTS